MPQSEDGDDQPQSMRTVAARGGAITLVSQGVRMVIVLVSTIMLARLISPTDYGLLAMVVAVTGLAEIFRDFGLSMAAIQAKTLTPPQKSNLFWINTGIGAVLTVAVFGLSWPLAHFYSEPALVGIVQMISPIYLMGAMGAQFRVDIIRSLRFGALALTELIPPVVAFGVALTFAIAGFGVAALVAQQLTMASVTLLALVIWARWWPGLPRRGQEMRPLLKFGANYLGVQLLAYTTRNIDSIAIGRVWGPTQLGYYDRAFQLAVQPLNQINAPLSRMAIPVLSRMTENRARYLAALRQTQLVALYVTTSVLCLISGLGAPIVAVLLGPQWAPSAAILSVLAMGSVFRSIHQVSHWMFMSQGLAGAALRFNLLGQPLVIAFTLAGLPWGAIGVAAGNSIGYVFYWASALLWAGRASRLNVKPLLVDAARTVLCFGAPAGLLAYATTLIFPLGPLLQLLVGTGVALLWFGVMYLLSARVRTDLRLLGSFAKLSLTGR